MFLNKRGVKPTVHLRYSVRQVCHATCVTHAYVRTNPTLAWQMTCLRKSQPREEVSELTDAKRPSYERLKIWHGRRDVRDRVDGQRALIRPKDGTTRQLRKPVFLPCVIPIHIHF